MHNRPRLLFLIVIVGAALRFVPIWFGLPLDHARPDEETAIGHAAAVLAGDPNPHFFHWPSLTFYVFAGAFTIASWVHRLSAFDPALTGNEQYVIARGVVALAGTATIVALYALARRMADGATALTAALFLAVAPLHVRESHFAMTDTLMTLLVTSSLGVLVRRRDAAASAAAGFAAGLAASAKYTGAAVLAVLLTPPYAAAPAAAFVAAFVGAFLAGTPFAAIDAKSFAAGIGFDAAHLSTGQAYLDLGRGWAYHLQRSLPYGMGLPVFAAAAAGVFVMARRQRSALVVIGAFCAALYAALAPGRTVFFRYVLPIAVLACVPAAVGVQAAAEWTSRRTTWRWAAAALPLLIALPSAVNSAWMDAVLARTDSRVLAGQWLAGRVTSEEVVYDAGGDYAGALMLGVSAHRWAPSTFDAGTGTFSDSGGRRPDWLVLPTSPLVYGSVPESLRRLAADEYVLAHTVAARRAAGGSVYDWQDAFFVPIAGFGPVIRPGPTIEIFRLRAGSSASLDRFRRADGSLPSFERGDREPAPLGARPLFLTFGGGAGHDVAMSTALHGSTLRQTVIGRSVPQR